MAIIFIDTNIVIEYLKSNKEVIEILAKYNTIYINDVVIMELYQGARNKRELNFIKNKIIQFEVLKINSEIIVLAKNILERYTLSHNTKIMDSLIASTVIIYNIDLYTINKKDFRYLKQVNMVEI
jgi:predicted nucleic acid-binding protein